MANRAVMLVEDEKEKALALLDALHSAGYAKSEISVCDAVRAAVLAVYKETFSLIILDVSLPTFSPDGMAGSAGRAQQQSGGIEVLRALKFSKKHPKIIIVTQYPDILFEDDSVKLEDVKSHAKKRYGQDVICAILYREADSTTWRSELNAALGSIQ